jgi:hypothetical protein
MQSRYLCKLEHSLHLSNLTSVVVKSFNTNVSLDLKTLLRPASNTLIIFGAAVVHCNFVLKFMLRLALRNSHKLRTCTTKTAVRCSSLISTFRLFNRSTPKRYTAEFQSIDVHPTEEMKTQLFEKIVADEVGRTYMLQAYNIS